MRNILRRFFLIFVPLFFMFYAGGMFVHYKNTLDESKSRNVESKRYVNLLEGLVKNSFQLMISDVMLLGNSQFTRDYLNFPTVPINQQNLTEEFKHFAKEKQRYSQIRILDNEGQEKIRVNWNKRAGVSVVSENALQNKFNRYYFTETFQLDQNEVYVSPFDLNVENEQIEVPFTPMIRIGTPLFNSERKKVGIILINFLGSYIIDDFKMMKRLLSGHNYLLNSNGYWIIGDHSVHEWAFMFPEKKDLSFSAKYDSPWKTIQLNHSGQFNSGNRVFTFSTIYPLREVIQPQTGFLKSSNPRFSKAKARKYFWKVVNVDPAVVLRYDFWLLSIDFIKRYYIILLMLFGSSLVYGIIYNNKDKVTKELVKLSRAVEQSPIPIVITDSQGTIEYVNPEFSEMTGYSSEEAIGANPRILKSGTHTEEHYKEMWQTISSGEQWQGELCNRNKSGEIFWEFGYISPLKNNKGQITNYIAFKEDITEKRKAELDLARLASFPEYNPNIVLETTNSLEILYMNHTCKSLFPELRQRQNDHPLLQSICIDKLPSHDVQDNDFYADEITVDRFIFVRHIRLISNNSVIRIYAFDVTDRKKIELELIQAKQKSEEVSQHKSTFLANMSHEIRTPMNAILGMTHLCLQTEVTPKQKDYLSKVHKAGTSLVGIINDILDFSKIEAGKLDLESVEFNLDNTLDNVSTLIEIKAQEKKLNYRIEFPSEIPRLIVGDSLRLEQILINLAGNSVKFTEHGEVVIKIDMLPEDQNPDDPNSVMLQFTVRDTGIGLSQEQIGNLFQPFSQADSSMTRKYGGTGLGLTIVKRLVEAMNGKIWVESEIGKGSQFVFALPLKKPIKKQNQASISLSEMDGLNILVVDDNRTSLKIFLMMLETFRFNVTLVDSGEDALTKLREAESPFELVIMDWKMPGLDGIQTSQEIRNLTSLRVQPKIILSTAFGQEKFISQTNRIKFDGFLYKPMTESELFDAIINVFSNDAEQVSLRGANHTIDHEPLKLIRGASILLVEDNEINQQVAQEILEQAGFNVQIAENGKKALERVKQHNFAALLMDLQMPVMNGYEATAEIRKDPELKDLPIIAMTADVMKHDREKVFESGMNDYVTKPIDLDHLFSTLLKWIKPGDYEPPKALKERVASIETVDQFPDLININTVTGLARTGGNLELYQRLLIKFYHENKGLTERIKQALQVGNQELAERLIHTIKGVSGNLGVNGLHSISLSLESVIIKGPLTKVLDQLVFFDHELNAVLNELKAIVDENNISSVPDTDLPRGEIKILQDQLNRLSGFLQKREPWPSSNIIKDIVQYSWSKNYTSLIDQISQLISNYKFIDAQKVLDRLNQMLTRVKDGVLDE